jgi:hypothetical protein
MVSEAVKDKRSLVMISKKILNPDRVRRIDGGFSFIPHQFLTDGFLDSLQPQELTLYVFLILAADRHGLSYYSYERICTLLHMTVEQYIAARDGLIEKDLIAFDGTVFQVLSLPSGPRQRSMNTAKRQPTGCQTPVAIGPIIAQLFKAT